MPGTRIYWDNDVDQTVCEIDQGAAIVELIQKPDMITSEMARFWNNFPIEFDISLSPFPWNRSRSTGPSIPVIGAMVELFGLRLKVKPWVTRRPLIFTTRVIWLTSNVKLTPSSDVTFGHWGWLESPYNWYGDQKSWPGYQLKWPLDQMCWDFFSPFVFWFQC